MQGVTNEERLFYLDFIRTIAVIAILLTHFNAVYLIAYPHEVWDKIVITYRVCNLYIGDFGVALFFIVSGAALMHVYDEKFEIKTFYGKRFLAIYPMFWVIGIFNPITVTLATRIFGIYQLVAYYCRLFLLMPIVFCIVYGMILNLKECKEIKKFCFAMALLAIIVVSGKCVYSEDWILKAENFNKVPDDVIELSSLINSEVTVMVPNDLTSYVRQYDSRIHLVYGRYAAGDEIAMQVSSETPDVGYIIEYGKEHNCDYVVCINSQSIIDGFMENDCVVYEFTDNYVIIQL